MYLVGIYKNYYETVECMIEISFQRTLLSVYKCIKTNFILFSRSCEIMKFVFIYKFSTFKFLTIYANRVINVIY